MVTGASGVSTGSDDWGSSVTGGVPGGRVDDGTDVPQAAREIDNVRHSNKDKSCLDPFRMAETPYFFSTVFLSYHGEIQAVNDKRVT